MSKKDFGLPEGFFVFGCFNNSYKINPEIFDIWMKILKKNKNSVLWLLNTDDCSKNLIKEAIKKKINPNRIIFCERASVEIYHSRFKFIDLLNILLGSFIASFGKVIDFWFKHDKKKTNTNT